jgi:hypothetical protein
MYTSVDFTSQIVGWRGSLVPQTRGSHTPIWCGLVVTSKIDYYYYYYFIVLGDIILNFFYIQRTLTEISRSKH